MPRHRRACIAGAARTSRVTPASGERSGASPHPQQQQGRPHLRADVRARDVAVAMTPPPLAARARPSDRPTSHAQRARMRSGKEAGGPPVPPATSRACVLRAACVRTCARERGPRGPMGHAAVGTAAVVAVRVPVRAVWCLGGKVGG